MNEGLSIGTEVPKHRTADRHSQPRMRDITRLDFRPWNVGVCQCVADCLQTELDVRGFTQILVAMPTYPDDIDRPKIADQLAHQRTARVRRMSNSPRLGRVSPPVRLRPCLRCWSRLPSLGPGALGPWGHLP